MNAHIERFDLIIEKELRESGHLYGLIEVLWDFFSREKITDSLIKTRSNRARGRRIKSSLPKFMFLKAVIENRSGHCLKIINI